MPEILIPSFLEKAFINGFTHTDDAQQELDCYVHEMGQLNVRNGKIIACDPFLYNGDHPYEAVFPTGRFPVQLSVAKIKTDQRVAFARIKFSDKEPVSWKLATCEGQDIAVLKKDEIFGYPVDAGTGCFMDSSSSEAFTALGEDLYDALGDDMEKTYKDTWSWLMWEEDGNNVALFSSGWGDGFYATYIGTDTDGNICRLVTDFAVIFEER